MLLTAVILAGTIFAPDVHIPFWMVALCVVSDVFALSALQSVKIIPFNRKDDTE